MKRKAELRTHFDVDDGYGGLGLVEVARHPVHGLWYIVQHQIQIHFIFLRETGSKRTRKARKSKGPNITINTNT